MNLLERAVKHIEAVAEIPSFSSYEERLHPYVHEVFSDISNAEIIDVPGNNLVYRIPGNGHKETALSAHLDKINHFGFEYPSPLPVKIADGQIEGAMDDSAGVGILLALAEYTEHADLPGLLFLFSEMEESKGLKEHPERLRNEGKGYESGMGAKRIAETCIARTIIPDEVITIDTTPLFKGDPGIAMYSRHWELNDLDPSEELINQTKGLEQRILEINEAIKHENNTNDYLHYGKIFNESGDHVVPSIALEPSIYPYHQRGEKVFINDIDDLLSLLTTYLKNKAS